MSKKKHDDHEEHVNHEAWVIPYADLLTLLMAMFLVLWSLGKTDAAKAQAVAAAFSAETGVGPSGGQLGGSAEGAPTTQNASTAEVSALQAKVGDAAAIQHQADARQAGIKAERDELEEARRKIQAELEAKGLTDQVQMKLMPEGLIIVATEGLLFGPGSAALGEPGARAIDIIAEPMRAMTQPVRIEGHTDATPIATGQFPSNWELSSARASTVLRHFIERFAFPPARLSAAGYADTQPVADNATPEGRAANRRVEIVLIATRASEPLQTGTDGVPGSSGVAGVPAPIGDQGPLGPPVGVVPGLPTPKSTTAPAAPPTTAPHASEQETSP
jgi:chemotaxis protein MotB